MARMIRRVAGKRRPRRPLIRRPMRKAVGRARGNRTSDYAKVVEIQETQLVAVNNVAGESVGAVMNFCLADFQRPQEVAHAYKYYRASKVELSFIPYANINLTGGAAGLRLPQLYYTVDRLSNRWIAPTETEMLERGVSPKLFTKKRKLVFKPNLLQELALETVQSANPSGQPLGINVAQFMNATAVFDKWLPTQQSFGYNTTTAGQVGQQIAPNGVNPYAVRYHGAAYCASIEGATPGLAAQVGDIQLKITWEFKGPRALDTSTPQPEPNPYAVTSTSSGAVPNTQPTTYPSP